MAYTAFKAGDKVDWDGLHGVVVEDTDENNEEVVVRIYGQTEVWLKVYEGISVTLEAIDAPQT